MLNLRLIYELLEVARNHLLRSTLLDYRLALILSDNVAELLMYRELDYRFRYDDSLMPRSHPDYAEWIRTGRGPKYTPEERQDAEREFEPKLRLLVRLKRISTEDRLILGICHRFRGAAFHRGELRREIVEHVSKLLYVTTACLTLKLPPRSYTLPDNPPASDDADFLKRFGLAHAHALLDEVVQKNIVETLLLGIEPDIPLLKESLSRDLLERIDATMAGLEEVGQTKDRLKLDRNIQYTQFWREVGGALLASGVYEPDLEAAYQKWQSEGRARYTLRMIDRWRRRAEAISRSASAGQALSCYSAIEKRFAPLEADVFDAVFRYEEEIDAEIKRRR